jgi:hypothetical protein
MNSETEGSREVRLDERWVLVDERWMLLEDRVRSLCPSKSTAAEAAVNQESV